MFRKILIANRGEIAVRVIRTCHEMGIRAVAVFSDADRTALHVRAAGEAVHIGPALASESYLNIERVLEAARSAGVDAIHPGYGFLSENPEFAAACENVGVKFIGPSPRSMRLMGSKTAARQAVEEIGVPVVPGTSQPLSGLEEAASAAGRIGFPVMLKAAAGGGGKGMRLVENASELASAFERAQHEAQAAFGNSSVYIEKAILRPRHVEVQILADEHGQTIHLGERECSIQRRHQKVLEESPSPLVEQIPDLREKVTAAAVRAAAAGCYTNAGTVEFLMDQNGAFYFLEMNTRLQVEHPVTEMITGLDLVKEQILVAAGERLRYRQHDIRRRGSAIECRIYAEDPDNNFFPSPGRITSLQWPSGPGVRVDSGAYAGWDVPLEYDSLIAKLIAWGPSRPEAIRRALRALNECHIGGIRTTAGMFRAILSDEDFQRGALDTEFLSRLMDSSLADDAAATDEETVALLAAAVDYLKKTREQNASGRSNGNAWRLLGKRSMLR